MTFAIARKSHVNFAWLKTLPCIPQFPISRAPSFPNLTYLKDPVTWNRSREVFYIPTNSLHNAAMRRIFPGFSRSQIHHQAAFPTTSLTTPSVPTKRVKEAGGVSGNGRLLSIDETKGLMKKNGEREFPDLTPDGVTFAEMIFFVDVEGTIADWENSEDFDWNEFWKSDRIGSNLFNKIKGPMFGQIRALLEYGWTKEEVIQRLVRGYYGALAQRKLNLRGTEWLPDFSKLFKHLPAQRYRVVIDTHAMRSFAIRESKEFLKSVDRLRTQHKLDVRFTFLSGSDQGSYKGIKLYDEVELEAERRVPTLEDPNGNLKEFFECTESELPEITHHYVPHLRKDQKERWKYVCGLLNIDAKASNLLLFDDQKKNREDGFLSFVEEERAHCS
jgi:hypothetical protein